MSTIQVKGSFKVVNQFIKDGGEYKTFDNIDDNRIFKLYYQHLIDINNKSRTISQKLRYIFLLEKYLVSMGKSFKQLLKKMFMIILESVQSYLGDFHCKIGINMILKLF